MTYGEAAAVMFEGSGAIDPKPEPNRRYFYKNGTYYPYDGYDAFYATYTYTTGFPTISENGTYSAADFGFDGLRGIYNHVDGGYTQGYNDGYEQAQKLIEESSGAGWIFFPASDYAFINVPGRSNATGTINVTDIADYSALAEASTTLDGYSDYIEDIDAYANKEYVSIYGFVYSSYSDYCQVVVNNSTSRAYYGNDAYIVAGSSVVKNDDLVGIGISSICHTSPTMLFYRDSDGNLQAHVLTSLNTALGTYTQAVYLCRGIIKTSFTYEGFDSEYVYNVYRGPTPSELYASSTFWSKRSAYYGG